ncbi:MAG: hypothetical protein M3478_06425, partial [Planctomycetota bacterium]|nr:hypothetical protein [Planctomycetota bacterium]
FDAIRDRPKMGMGNSTDGALAVDGDWLYYGSCSAWRRIDLKTNREEALLEDPRQLPNYFNGPTWLVAHSSHYGLVGFCRGQLYKVTVLDAVTP